MNTTETSFRTYEDIEKVFQSYLTAATTGDASGLEHDWLEHTHVVGSVDGQAINVNRDEAIVAIGAMGASPNAESKIVWMDVQGNAAAVRIDSINWAGFRFTDYFLLSNIEGTWKVSGKVFDAHDRN